MEGLFFAITPIWWIAPLHLTSILISIIGGMGIGLILWVYHMRPEKITIVPKKQRYIPVSAVDPHYAGNSLMAIRTYLSSTYAPIHSWAHTPTDIRRYVGDARLIEIIEQLEKSEYSDIELDQREKELINTELIDKLGAG